VQQRVSDYGIERVLELGAAKGVGSCRPPAREALLSRAPDDGCTHLLSFKAICRYGSTGVDQVKTVAYSINRQVG
jgi:hypothetical protein